MIEVFWYFLSIVIFLAFCVGISVFYRFIISDKYLRAQRALQAKINEAAGFLKEAPELNRKRVGAGIETLGIRGILQELGIPGAAIVAPFVEGFLSNPDNVKKAMGIAERLGFKIPDVNKSQGQEINLL